jgi:hypothetical protein
MFKVTVFHGSQGEPHASVREVEAVPHGSETLYRDVESGRVDRIYSCMHELVFDSRDDAVEFASSRLRALSVEFATNCEKAIKKLRSTEVVA